MSSYSVGGHGRDRSVAHRRLRTGPLRVHAAMGVGAGFTTRRGPQITEEGGAILSLAPPTYERVRYDKVVNLPIQLGVSLDSEHSDIGLDFIGSAKKWRCRCVRSTLGLE